MEKTLADWLKEVFEDEGLCLPNEITERLASDIENEPDMNTLTKIFRRELSGCGISNVNFARLAESGASAYCHFQGGIW